MTVRIACSHISKFLVSTPEQMSTYVLVLSLLRRTLFVPKNNIGSSSLVN